MTNLSILKLFQISPKVQKIKIVDNTAKPLINKLIITLFLTILEQREKTRV